MLGSLPLVLIFAGTIFVRWFNIIFVIIPVDTSFHFGLMTVNALFGGFLYSNYSILVGLLDNSTIQSIQGTNIMAKRNALASKGIIYAAFSVLSGIYILLMVNRTGVIWDTIFCFAINCEMRAKSLQNLAGHGDIQTTLGIYTHSSYEQMEQEFKRIASV